MRPIGNIYIIHLINGLKELANRNYQEAVWLNVNNPGRYMGSFIEAYYSTFSDSLVDNALETGRIILDEAVTNALRELKIAVDVVNESRSEQEIIADPLMEVVRTKAATALRLIQASDGKGGNVKMLELGMPATYD